jgi:putative transcription factor
MSDWDTVTVLRKKRTPAEAKSQAVAKGTAEFQRKPAAGTNKPSKPPGSAAKIEAEDETFVVPTVNTSISRAIASARQKAGMTQKDLAVKINEKQAVVNEYESGRAVTNQAILAKFERELKVKLRGPPNLIGSPLQSSKL